MNLEAIIWNSIRHQFWVTVALHRSHH